MKKVKAIKDCLSPKGTVALKSGQTADVLDDSADRWVKEGTAEELKPKRPVNIKKLLEQKIDNGNN